jgi:hypothetical protein
LPGQNSATSQDPATERHSVETGRNASVGHVLEVPVQVSIASQMFAELRQVAPELPAGCWHVTLLPSH